MLRIQIRLCQAAITHLTNYFASHKTGASCSNDTSGFRRTTLCVVRRQGQILIRIFAFGPGTLFLFQWSKAFIRLNVIFCPPPPDPRLIREATRLCPMLPNSGCRKPVNTITPEKASRSRSSHTGRQDTVSVAREQGTQKSDVVIRHHSTIEPATYSKMGKK